MSTSCRLHTAAKRADQIRSDRRRCVQIGASLLLRGATATRPGGARAPSRGCARAHCVGVFLGGMAAACHRRDESGAREVNGSRFLPSTSFVNGVGTASDIAPLHPQPRFLSPATAADHKARLPRYRDRSHPASAQIIPLDTAASCAFFDVTHTPRPAVAVDLLKTPFFFFCASLRDDQAKIDKARVRF
jgi:hypothetical protein